MGSNVDPMDQGRRRPGHPAGAPPPGPFPTEKLGRNSRQDARHLLNFRYQPRNVATERDRARSRHAASGWRGSGMRNSQPRASFSVHAEHRFILSDAADRAALNPDAHVVSDLWDAVAEVVVFAHEVPTCPITLEELFCPQMTPCGHLFSGPAIVQHVSGFEAGLARCPICLTHFRRGELRLASIRLVALPQVDMAWEFERILRSRTVWLRVVYDDTTSVNNKTPSSQEDTQAGTSPSSRWISRKLPATENPSSETPRHSVGVHADRFARFTLIGDSLPLFQEQAGLLGVRQTQVCNEGGTEAQLALQYLQESVDLLAQQAGRLYAWQDRMRTSNQASSSAGASHSALNTRVVEATKQAASDAAAQRASLNRLEHEFPTLSLGSGATGVTSADADNVDVELPPAGLMESEQVATPTTTPSDLVSIFQSHDGQYIFLHPVTLQMLELDAQLRNEPLAESISANIVEIEKLQQTAQTRKRFPSLAHLPLNATFCLCELDLKEVVQPTVLHKFADSLAQRAAKRVQRAKVAARKDRAESKAAAAFQELHAYPRPQQRPPLEEDLAGFQQLCEGPALGSSPPSPLGPPGGVSYARLTKEGFAATGPSLGSPNPRSEGHSARFAPQGVWASGSSTAGTKTDENASTASPLPVAPLGKKGKKTLISSSHRRY